MAEVVTQARALATDSEPARVVIRPPAVKDTGFEVVRTKDGAYLIRGEKPSRWVAQTDFTNDEAIGYLADRLARLGVEEALAKAGADAGATVLIGDFDDAVVFDWDPELEAGGGHMAGPRGTDRRLQR
jgi:GTP-binding protein